MQNIGLSILQSISERWKLTRTVNNAHLVLIELMWRVTLYKAAKRQWQAQMLHSAPDLPQPLDSDPVDLLPPVSHLVSIWGHLQRCAVWGPPFHFVRTSLSLSLMVPLVGKAAWSQWQKWLISCFCIADIPYDVYRVVRKNACIF